MRYKSFASILFLLSPIQPLQAVDLTGRFAMLGATAQAEPGDIGYQESVGHYLSADQQSVRLMLEEGGTNSEWSAHLRTVRSHNHGFPASVPHSSALFRYSDLAGTIVDESDGTTSTQLRYELDRLFYRRHMNDYTVTAGRQAIDWGSGRFWQPLNVFGSFAPTDLDTDYKPGIDALTVDLYPSSFSSLTAVYAFAPENQSIVKNSAALHYRRQIGEASELNMLAASISGNSIFGGSFESAWKGLGWRVEGVHYQLRESDEKALFWIAGLDYQFANGTLLSAEYYDNSRGAMNESELLDIYSDELIAVGLQPQLSRQLMGLGLAHDITPLLDGSYTLLTSTLKDNGGNNAWSFLHQLNITYSVSNESDLLASLLIPSGKGLTSPDEPQSEFGHIPLSLSLRLRFYF